jgi:acyl-CoA thioester hydrolase
LTAIATEVRVRYADTDQMGVAYYANYLVWFEVGRNEYMRARGYPYIKLEAQNMSMPVIEVRCKYHASARYDDLLSIETSIEDISYVQLRFGYRVIRQQDQELLVTGITRHAALGNDGRPKRIPEEVKKWLRD